jgi:hypothetical protein
VTSHRQRYGQKGGRDRDNVGLGQDPHERHSWAVASGLEPGRQSKALQHDRLHLLDGMVLAEHTESSMPEPRSLRAEGPVSDHRPRVKLLILMLILKPLPGERQKSSSLLILTRNWRSKWVRVTCCGQAKRCKAGTCRHVQYVCETYPRCRPKAYDA